MAEISCRSLTQPRRTSPHKPKLYGAILGLGAGQEQQQQDGSEEEEADGLDFVECSLDVGGVVCRAEERDLEQCPDIEYRIKCDCESLRHTK